jgi:amino acid adenylation domain-containing protein
MIEGNDGQGMATEAEQRQIAAWNATARPYPTNWCVPDLVALRTAEMPMQLAVDDGADALTYAELNTRANRLARRLQSRGVAPEVPVALFLPRSVGLVVAALAVMKAGGAYVPLDPAYPDDRLASVLSDAKPRVIVTETRLAERLPTVDRHLMMIEGVMDSTERTEAPEDPRLTPDHLAYVIYTSGSTGRPKGVQITHGALLNLVFWHREAFSITPDDRASQHASPGFDAAVWELWPYLTAGASVHVMDDATRLDPEGVRDWLVKRGITVSFLPTPLAERVMAASWPEETQLRLLLTGADTLHVYPPPSLPFEVVNNYGPTECTVVATSGIVRPNENSERLPTIGRAIANTQIHILDDQMRPVPIGRPGEIYIGGAGVARGYLDRAGLDAQKFVRDPFRSEPGARLYRTGDLGRYLPGGEIAFLGRIDGQVKIRGYRIETDEIVAVLNTHPAVAASAVVTREDTPGERRLVAYVVPRDGTAPPQGELIATLEAALPDYMVPATFVLVDALPLSPSGKVDRAALPAPDSCNTLREQAFVAPRTVVEEQLASILAGLLSLDRVGVNENFFLLGGHSLLGAQLVSRIRETFDANLALRTLFASPTIEALAAEIERDILAKIEATEPIERDAA